MSIQFYHLLVCEMRTDTSSEMKFYLHCCFYLIVECVFSVVMGRQLNRPTSLLRQPFLYKCLVGLIFVALIVTNFTFWTSNKTDPQKCFTTFGENHSPAIGEINLLEDISESETKPKLGKSIFFHETSCGRNGMVRLNARYARSPFCIRLLLKSQ